MRALSLTQPWATAIAIELKRWETRSWPCALRGQICIHASKGFPRWAKEVAIEQANANELPELLPQNLPTGKIICVADLVECRQTKTARLEISERERSWGDFAEGRYCFRFENVIPLAAPVMATGALGFWRVDFDAAKEIVRQLKPEDRRFAA